ncbi:glycosyltransferase [Corynebacterium sp. HMSC072A02]|uniref:glycosyltransferase n=1 Tax=Corynebacterium sp. HMSC072A02 TaxID=1715177 RepID=UPI00114D1170|nr:glycosyltransferase [Corynebacterium sp. HMSC072A02]
MRKLIKTLGKKSLFISATGLILAVLGLSLFTSSFSRWIYILFLSLVFVYVLGTGLYVTLIMRNSLSRLNTRVNGLHHYSKGVRDTLRDMDESLQRQYIESTGQMESLRYLSSRTGVLISQLENIDAVLHSKAALPVVTRESKVEEDRTGAQDLERVPEWRSVCSWPRADSRAKSGSVEHPTGFSSSIDEIVPHESENASIPRFVDEESIIQWRHQSASDLPTQITLEKGGNGVEVNFDAKPGDVLEIEVPVIADLDSDGSNKAGLIWARAFAADGEPIDAQLLSSPNPRLGSYSYLDDRRFSNKCVDLVIPTGTTRLHIGIEPWEKNISVAPTFKLRRSVPNREWLQARNLKDLRVAVVLDEFSFKSFAPEFQPIVVSPSNWREKFLVERPDLFLCESAWSGPDSVNREWKGSVYSSINFEKENRHALLSILEYCNEHSIPTVFWNKEDPTHYTDKVHNFVDTAVRFDHIFTTDAECVERYKQDFNHPSVHCLPFAVQPRLFNPIEDSSRTSALVFAGGWYSNHEDRSASMTRIFRSALSSGRGLKIYDRFHASGDPLHMYPEEFEEFTVPPVSYDQVSRVYKESELGLTINTVVDSETMFARRIFELMACNTYVVSNYSKGVEDFFGDTVTFADLHPDELKLISREEIARRRRVNLNRVLQEHTYRNRFQSIVDTVGLKYRREHNNVDLVVTVATEADCRETLYRFDSLGLNRARLFLMVQRDCPGTQAAKLFEKFNRNNTLVFSERMLVDGRLRTSALFGSSAEILFFPAGVGLSTSNEEIRMLRAHRQYISDPIAPVSSQKYKYQLWNGNTPMLVATDGFERLLQVVGEPTVRVYGV